MAPTGLNLVEFHGLIPTLAEMQLADELGVNLAILPRCDGRIQANMTHVQQESHALQSQDIHIINHTLHAPSVLMWSTEGGGINRADESVGRAIIKNMKADYEDRVDDHIIKSAEISKARRDISRRIRELTEEDKQTSGKK